MATKSKKEPKDAEQRIAKREELRELMKTTLAKQGAFGVIQTQRWLKAYKRATRCVAREMPTVAGTNKIIAALNEACAPFKG